MGLVISNLFENCKTHYNDLRDSGHKLLKLYYCLSYMHFYCFSLILLILVSILFYFTYCHASCTWASGLHTQGNRSHAPTLVNWLSDRFIHCPAVGCYFGISRILSSFSCDRLLPQHLAHSQFSPVFDC